MGPQLMELCLRYPIKLIHAQLVDDIDPATASRNTRYVGYIETEHAFADSGSDIFLSADSAKEEAARRLLEALERVDGDDRRIGNLSLRSHSPGCPVRNYAAASMATAATDADLLLPQRAKSTSPRARSHTIASPYDADESSTRRRSSSILGSLKSLFSMKRGSKSPR